MANENEEKVENLEKKSKGKSGIILILLVIILVGAGGAGGMYYFMSQKNNTTVVETKVPISEEMTVKLADKDKARYLKLAVTISYNEKNSKLGEEITAKQVEITDKIRYILSSQKAEDYTSANETKLKKKLIEGINSLLDKGEIENIYFPGSFLIQ